MEAPRLDGIVETSLYVEDLRRSALFYEGVLGLERLFGDERLAAYDAGRRTVLLLFVKGTTGETVELPEGTIPPHDGGGRIHVAFAIPAADVARWEARLAEAATVIEGRTHWPKGGMSLYFRDPDGHLVELATPGLWPTY